MAVSKDVADVVTEDLLILRQKVQGLVADGQQPPADAHDAYVSAIIGHLFATLLTGFGPGITAIDQSSERLAYALQTIARKVSAVAGSLDRSADYRIEILRREKDVPK